MLIKHLLQALLCILCSCFMFSCQESDLGGLTLSANAVPHYVATTEVSTLNLSAVSQEKTIEVKANCAWTVECVANWITVKTKSGYQDGTLSITVEYNVSTDARQASLILYSKDGVKQQTIVVVQDGTDFYLDVEKPSLSLSSETHNIDLSITTNDIWVAECSESWINITRKEGDSSKKLSIQVSENTGPITRFDTLKVSGKLSGLQLLIRVEQAGKDYYLDAEKTILSLLSGPQNIDLTITTNDIWIAECSESWINITRKEGDSSQMLSFSVSENADTKYRTGNMTVNGKFSGLQLQIRVVQGGKNYYLNAEKTILSLLSNPQNVVLSITTNDTWVAECSESWIDITQKEGDGNQNLSFNVLENVDMTSRTGILLVSGKASGLQLQIRVEQAGKDYYLDAEKTILSLSSGPQNIDLTIITNDIWVAECSESWINITRKEGDSSQKLSFSVSENADAKYRTGNMTVNGKVSGLQLQIRVVQGGSDYFLDAEKLYLSLSSSPQNIDLAITTNDNWIAESNESWIDITRKEGDDNQKLSFKVLENASTTSRTGFLLVSGKVSGLQLQIRVDQAGKDYYLDSEKTYLSLSSGPQNIELAITTNDTWVAECSESWINITRKEGDSSQRLSFKVSENVDITSRTGTLVVKGKISGLQLQIRVEQTGKYYYLDAEKTNLSLSSGPQNIDIKITTNDTWVAECNESWISITRKEGDGRQKLSFNVSENVGTTFRTGTLAVKGKISGLQLQIQVKQGGKEIYTVNGVTFKMIAVQGGTFQMGATSEQQNPLNNENPVHTVTLSDYSIGESEVTQELWEAVMGMSVAQIAQKIGYPTFGVGVNYPMYYVSWSDCQTFIQKLNTLTGATFRLPTEAEWEFAARGGNKSHNTQYSGSTKINVVAWYKGNSNGKTHTVKTMQPNELGLYDMSGNVWEWCQDWYGSYSSDSQTNPQGPSSGGSRLIRGGGWTFDEGGCRTARRSESGTGIRSSDIGLRLAL